MAKDIISSNPNDILEKFQSVYVDQIGQRMRIGSEEYTLSAIYSYVLSHYAELINKSYANQNLDTASGDFLDNIASKYGLNRTRPTYSNPWFETHIRINPNCDIYGAHSDSFTFQIFKGGTWYRAVKPSDDPNVKLSNDYVRWVAVTSSDEYATKQEILDAFLSKERPSKADPNVKIPMFVNMTVNDVTDVQGVFNAAKGGNIAFAPMTDDDVFREYIKKNKNLYRPGIAGSFEAVALNSSDLISDAHVVRPMRTYFDANGQPYTYSDPDFVPGKVRVICKPRIWMSASDFTFSESLYNLTNKYDIPLVADAIASQDITVIGQDVEVYGPDSSNKPHALYEYAPTYNSGIPLVYTFYVPKAYNMLFDPDPSVINDRVDYITLYRLKFAAVIAYINKYVLKINENFMQHLPAYYMQMPLSSLVSKPEDLDILDDPNSSQPNAYNMFDYYKDLPVLGLKEIEGAISINGFNNGIFVAQNNGYIILRTADLYEANNNNAIRCNIEYI